MKAKKTVGHWQVERWLFAGYRIEMNDKQKP